MSENTAETPDKTSTNAFSAFKNYDNFKGKASQSEFWSFFLLIHVVILVLLIPGIPLFFREAGKEVVNKNWHADLALALPLMIWGALVVIPLCALLVRRLNNAPFGYYILGLFVVVPVLLYIYCTMRPGLSFWWSFFWLYELLLVIAGCMPEKVKPAKEEKAPAEAQS